MKNRAIQFVIYQGLRYPSRDSLVVAYTSHHFLRENKLNEEAIAVIVDIPENYLLIIASHGNMGSGDLPTFMKMWAQKLCVENGLSEKLREAQIENTIQLRTRISNVLGTDSMQKIDASISEAIKKLK